MKSFRHASELAAVLEDRGHQAQVFGVGEDDGPPLKSVTDHLPNAILAYDALSPAAWQGSRLARRCKIPLVLVEAGAFAAVG